MRVVLDFWRYYQEQVGTVVLRTPYSVPLVSRLRASPSSAGPSVGINLDFFDISLAP